MTPESGTGTARGRTGLRVAVSLALVGVLLWLLDAGVVLERLGSLDPAWVAAALAVSVLQVAASAWRWRFTARALGLSLPMGAALREYYLGTFLNQLLPGGVAGDVSRAWRHAREVERAGPAVRAVVLERASGQVVMAATAVGCLTFLPVPGAPGPRLALGGGLALMLVGAAVWVMGRRRAAISEGEEAPADTLVGRVGRDVRAGLLAPRVLPVQLATSAFVVATYLATWVAAARAVGLEGPWTTHATLGAPILMAMLVPLTVAGWGAREGAAAALFAAVGLSASDGMAVSVAYGLLVLASSLPGGLVLVGLAGGRSRRGPQVELEEHVAAQGEDPAPGA